MPKKLDNILKDLIGCRMGCAGIVNKPEKGIVPRCLVLEQRNVGKGAIVVGLNPGKCQKEEMQFFMDNQNDPKAFEKYFFQKIKNISYFKRARNILSLLGFKGDILWTDLVKCQCVGENGIIPIQTMRVCISKFFKKEIESVFPRYTIFALGNKAFEFCSLSFPKHLVVGLPHTSGSFGTFVHLYQKVEKNPEKFQKIISAKKDKNGHYQAIKLF
jgi:hypothetical protein